MILIIGKDDQVIYHQGDEESVNTLFELYSAMDIIQLKRDTSEKMFYNLSSEESQDQQCIFVLPASHNSTIFYVCKKTQG